MLSIGQRATGPESRKIKRSGLAGADEGYGGFEGGGGVMVCHSWVLGFIR